MQSVRRMLGLPPLRGVCWAERRSAGAVCVDCHGSRGGSRPCLECKTSACSNKGRPTRHCPSLFLCYDPSGQDTMVRTGPRSPWLGPQLVVRRPLWGGSIRCCVPAASSSSRRLRRADPRLPLCLVVVAGPEEEGCARTSGGQEGALRACSPAVYCSV